MNLIEATETLLTYQAKLKQEILDLRAQACSKAAIVRKIDEIVTDQDVAELQSQKEVEKAYSLKGISDIVFNKDK
jgi:hypothetical protein